MKTNTSSYELEPITTFFSAKGPDDYFLPDELHGWNILSGSY